MRGEREKGRQQPTETYLVFLGGFLCVFFFLFYFFSVKSHYFGCIFSLKGRSAPKCCFPSVSSHPLEQYGVLLASPVSTTKQGGKCHCHHLGRCAASSGDVPWIGFSASSHLVGLTPAGCWIGSPFCKPKLLSGVQIIESFDFKGIVKSHPVQLKWFEAPSQTNYKDVLLKHLPSGDGLFCACPKSIACRRAAPLNSGVGAAPFWGSSAHSKKDTRRKSSFHKSHNKGRKHRKQRGYSPVSRGAEEEWGRQRR